MPGPGETDPAKAFEAAAKSVGETFKDINLEKMQVMFEKITESVQRWNESLDRTVKDMEITIGFMSQAAQINQNLEIGGKSRNQDLSITMELRREERAMNLEAQEAGESLFKQLKRDFELRKQALEIEHQHTAAAYNTGEAFAKSLTHLEGVMPSLLAAIPFGGFLGFLLAGAVKEAQFHADTQKVVQAWKVMGSSAQEFGGDVEHMLKDFQADSIASAQELQQIAAAFAAMGVSAGDALTKGDLGGNMLDRMGLNYDNIFQATLALDKLNQASAGTFATLAGKAVRDFNEDIVPATQDLLTYSMASQDAMQNTLQFMDSVMQNAGQLKLYGVHLGGVMDMTLKVIDANRKQGFKDGFSGQLAAAGVGEMLGGIKGMGEGLAAYMGQRVFSAISGSNQGKLLDKHGGEIQMSAVGAMMEFQRGGRDLRDSDQKTFLAHTVQQLGQMTKEAGLKGLDAEFMLKKFGMGNEGSHVVMQLFDKMGGKFAPEKLGKEDQEKLNNALMSESEKTSAVVQLLNNLKTAIADIGNGLLGMILASLGLLIKSVTAIGETIRSIPGMGGSAEARDAAWEDVAKSAGRVGEYTNQFIEGADRLGHAAGKVGGIGALHELADIMQIIAGGKKGKSDWDEFREKMADDFKRRDDANWKDAVGEGLDGSSKPMMPWTALGIKVGNTDDPGHISGPMFDKMVSAMGREEAEKARDKIYKSYYNKYRGLAREMHINTGDGDVSVTFHIGKGDNDKAMDAGAGGH